MHCRSLSYSSTSRILPKAALISKPPQLLSINNYYYRRGGSETVFFEHNRLFEDVGWTVVPFSMQHPDNEATAWARYFVDESRVQESRSPLSRGVRAVNAIYSNEAARRIGQLVDASRPDVAHAHNIYHHLSPSILVELRRRRIPIVLTLHDLKLACPAYKMYSHGAVCEKCRGGALRHVITNRCIKGSVAMSSLVWLESTVHRLFDIYHRNVTQFVVPSRFLLAKLAEWGIDTRRFTHVPNSVDVDALVPQGEPGDAFVYLGRLMPEKGVGTLVRAAAQARVRLRIVGTGPEEENLRRLAAELGSEVEFSGYLRGPALQAAISSARAVVLSSELYENAPLSALESSALARPVIGADIGGIPELIRHEETGFVYRSGNVDSLVEALARVQRLPVEALARMGRAAREWMRAEFSPTVYRERMLSIYRGLGVASVN
jgi:glycosyltransferase involved in cell wall biosynthesis